jgi:uncharacterized coiled-coil protein SlyX
MKSRLKPNYSAKSVAGKRTQFVSLFRAGTIGCLLFFAACGEESQGLDERITQLHKELDRTQAELQSAKEELARLQANAPGAKRDEVNPPPTSSTTFASREVLEASYLAEAKALKKKLQSELKDSTLGSFTLHNVQLPDNQFPITSWISLAFQTGDGKQFRVDFAVKADAKGDWVFPQPAEVVRRASEAKKTASTSDTPERRAPNEPPPNVATTMPSNSTSVIQWPGSTSSQTSRDAPKSSEAEARQNPAAAPPAPQAPQAPPAQAPKQAIPADRDVLIRF